MAAQPRPGQIHEDGGRPPLPREAAAPRRQPAGGGGAGSLTALPLAFFDRPTLEVARDLLGKLLVREVGGRRLEGRLVEVEAYCGPEDLASHSSRGLTPRTRVMFGPPGYAYVYLVYGMHNCLNFVTGAEGVPHAILVRALEPGPGVGRCSGPGLVCRSLEIDRDLNGAPLRPPDLYLLDDGRPPRPIQATPRIGVDYAGEWRDRPWRFCLDSPHLSRRLRPTPIG